MSEENDKETPETGKALIVRPGSEVTPPKPGTALIVRPTSDVGNYDPPKTSDDVEPVTVISPKRKINGLAVAGFAAVAIPASLMIASSFIDFSPPEWNPDAQIEALELAPNVARNNPYEGSLFNGVLVVVDWSGENLKAVFKGEEGPDWSDYTMQPTDGTYIYKGDLPNKSFTYCATAGLSNQVYVGPGENFNQLATFENNTSITGPGIAINGWRLLDVSVDGEQRLAFGRTDVFTRPIGGRCPS
jgi:hypothetical protein